MISLEILHEIWQRRIKQSFSFQAGRILILEILLIHPDIMIHGSGPSVVGRANLEVWVKATGKPFVLKRGYWFPDEAASVYARAFAVLSF